MNEWTHTITILAYSLHVVVLQGNRWAQGAFYIGVGRSLHTELATAGNMVCAWVFSNCPNKMTSWKKFSFHRLPFCDLNLLKLWLVALKMDLNTEVGTLKRVDYRVCSTHFAREDFFPPKAQKEKKKSLYHSPVDQTREILDSCETVNSGDIQTCVSWHQIPLGAKKSIPPLLA